MRLQTILLCADRFRSLALLRLVHHASNEAMTRSPSWVIDWAADDTPDPFDYGRQRLSNGGIDAPQIPEMISRSDGMAIAAISDARLCVDALCLSTVKDSFRTRIAPTSHALSAVLEVLSLLGLTYEKTGEPLEAALFAVMTASNCPEGFGQSNLDHICNLIANTTVSGLYGLWAKGLTAKSATMESGGVFWSITGRDADETQEEDWLGTHIFPPRSSTSPSNLVKALGRAETALSIVVAYITGSSWQAEPGWTWETPLSPAEITLQAYQQRILRGRALFVTGDGLLGLGPGIAQADDELWLIAGRRVPCLLRRVPESKGGGRDKYWFVGEAWVHGIMDGEWMEDGVAPVFKRIELV